MRRLKICAAPFASILMILAVAGMMPMSTSTGIEVVPVRLSKDDCNHGREVVIYVDSSGGLQIGAEPVTNRELDSKLAQRLRTRAEKVVFIDASGDLPFGQVAALIDRVSTHSSVVALLPRHGDTMFPCLSLPADPPWTPGHIPLSNGAIQ